MYSLFLFDQIKKFKFTIKDSTPIKIGILIKVYTKTGNSKIIT